MACTALKVGDVRIKFVTNPIEFPAKDGSHSKVFLNIELHNCDENFIPIGKTSKGLIDIEEAAYHKDLRKEAFSRGHYVPEESTDPEWNPEEIAHSNEDGEDTDQGSF